MSENQNVPTVDSSAFDGAKHPVSVDVPYEKINEYMANTAWNTLVEKNWVVFKPSTNPTAELIQNNGPNIYLGGKNIDSTVTQQYKDSTIEATIGYLNGEPA